MEGAFEAPVLRLAGVLRVQLLVSFSKYDNDGIGREMVLEGHHWRKYDCPLRRSSEDRTFTCQPILNTIKLILDIASPKTANGSQLTPPLTPMC